MPMLFKPSLLRYITLHTAQWRCYTTALYELIIDIGTDTMVTYNTPIPFQ